jgi:acyl carrier protein
MSPVNDDQILGAIRAELDHMKIEGGYRAERETLWSSLDVDSLDLVELVKALEDRFDVRIPECSLRSMLSVGDAMFVVRSLRMEAAAAA